MGNKQGLKIILGGQGGQGLVLAGKILAEAAALYDGKQTVYIPLFTPFVRGDISGSQVIIDEVPIVYPFVEEPDIILALSKETLQLYRNFWGRALLIVDEKIDRNELPPPKKAFPIHDCVAKLGGPRLMNMASVGILVGTTQSFTPEAIERVMTRLFSGEVLKLNLEAFRWGVESGKSQS